MKRVIQANINRFKLCLEAEADPTNRTVLFRLLAEQEAKLNQERETPSAVKKAH
jgi:hypothetical protein